VGLGAEDISRERGELKDVFAKLHASLSLGAVPDSLPCREQERQRLGGFLNRALTEGKGLDTASVLLLHACACWVCRFWPDGEKIQNQHPICAGVPAAVKPGDLCQPKTCIAYIRKANTSSSNLTGPVLVLMAAV